MRDRIRDDAVDAYAGEHERQQAEAAERPRRGARGKERQVELLLQRLHARQGEVRVERAYLLAHRAGRRARVARRAHDQGHLRLVGL